MSSAGNDDSDQSARRGIPGQLRKRLHATWAAVDNEKPDVSRSTKRQFARVVVSYYRALRPHRYEEAIKDEWRDADIHWVADGTETTTIRIDSPGRTGAAEPQTVPIREAVDIARLEQVASRLEDMARDLGITESVRENTPANEATEGDLVGLLTARGQESALENLPERFKNGSQ